MGTYIPNTQKQQDEMLKAAGYKDFDDLFSCIPDDLKLNRQLELAKGLSELSVWERAKELSDKNKTYNYIYRGAGAYNHFIPAIVKSVTSKEEFVTAYTPYQAELSQGILQSIFEYQTAICELTGMDVSNASVYDAGTAAAEAVNSCRDRKRKNAYVSAAVNPKVSRVISTYCFGSNTKMQIINENDGVTDQEALREILENDKEAACVYIQQPNFYGILEDVEGIAGLVHEYGAKLIVGVNPTALGLIKSPGECGADFAVGDAQSLGLPLGFGGPYIGFMACKKELMRSLPGRIVGETKDGNGNRAFVLTLQAREQHIRREKAGSNICSNEALCALTASVYLAALGAKGLEKLAKSCMSKAHYLQRELDKIGFTPAYDLKKREFFHEFVTESPVDTGIVMKELEKEGILGGLTLEDGRILWCVTEKCSKENMDALIAILKNVH